MVRVVMAVMMVAGVACSSFVVMMVMAGEGWHAEGKYGNEKRQELFHRARFYFGLFRPAAG
jgi:hypothetical protein